MGWGSNMAKPKIFLSSTCYDLKMVRSELTDFLDERGFEVINSEMDSFGITPGLNAQTACLDEVHRADYLLLLIGKRYGTTYTGSESSITNEEYNRAVSNGIPCIVCVLREVESHRVTYKKNPTADYSHIVDDHRIFHFIDYISSAHSDNWIHNFENIDDLRRILTTQFAHYLYLFSQFQRPKEKTRKESESALFEFPINLDVLQDRGMHQELETALRNGLKTLYDIMVSILRSDIKDKFKLEKIECLWVFGLYGESTSTESLRMTMDLFKQYAWSYYRGTRVFNQFAPFGVHGDFNEGFTSLSFGNENEDTAVAGALSDFVNTLLEHHPEREAKEIFRRADMRCYMKT